MNTERILAVADKIESLPTVDPREHTSTHVPVFGMRNVAHACGTPACITGWTLALFGQPFGDANMARASGLLGLSAMAGNDLFTPDYSHASFRDTSPDADGYITAARAAAVLRLVAAGVDVESAWAQTAPEADTPGTPDTPDTPDTPGTPGTPGTPDTLETVADAWAMRCPACGKDDTLVINATVSVRLRPDGTDDENSGGHEWGDDSPCTCGAVDGCGFSGKVRAFNIPDLKDALKDIKFLIRQTGYRDDAMDENGIDDLCQRYFGCRRYQLPDEPE